MRKLILVLLTVSLLASGVCGCVNPMGNTNAPVLGADSTAVPGTLGSTVSPDLGSDDEAFGDTLDSLNAYAGDFEGDLADISVTCVSGNPNAYTFENNTLTFSGITKDTVYEITGKLNGNIVIDIPNDDCKFELELRGLSLVCEAGNPITITGGDKVSIKAKSGFENYIYDKRAAVDEADETLYSGTIHAETDLEISGKGSLTVVSENNNGIHTKDDLDVKNLTLLVACTDNALKGNDSVTVENATTTLIAAQGDGIKTTNTDISSKGNQRGIVTITGGTHNIFAACDGIDASYDINVAEASTKLSIYTDKYSNYSTEVTAVADEIYYLRTTTKSYFYSVKYSNSDTDVLWVTPEFDSEKQGGKQSVYYYYKFEKHADYASMQLFVYDDEAALETEENTVFVSDALAPNSSYDTLAFGSSYYGGYNVSWTNYTTAQGGGNGWPGGGGGGRPGGDFGGGFGGMNDGNTDKGDHSTKGLKAGNEINISAGEIAVKSYDDAIHGANITLSGGTLSLYTNDDGIHADSALVISGGSINIAKSYEGLEGTSVTLSGGYTTVISTDDGINGTTTTGTAITVSGGTNYIYCSGDGIDSNSRSSYSGISFEGGNTLIISNSRGNSSIDTESGYKYTGGKVVAIMPQGGMSHEASNCQNFSSVATKSSISLVAGEYFTVTESGNGDSAATMTFKAPLSLSGEIIYLGSANADFGKANSVPDGLDANGVRWK